MSATISPTPAATQRWEGLDSGAARVPPPAGASQGGQLELFEAHLPAKPYCADDFKAGLRVLPAPAAKRRRYIEPQPPWSHIWLTFDVDRDASWYAADEAGLPAPSILAVNRENGHGHLLYGLSVPLRMDTWGGRQAPVRYAETIERAMVAKLRADAAYSGFVCKNPLHRHWAVQTNGHLFTLPELHGWIGDLTPFRRRRGQRRTGIGRNVETFDAVRFFAYANVLQHKADGGSLETWRMACIGAAEQFTADNHADPLQRSECRWIGNSVARWTWRKFTAARFSQIQAEQGRGGEAVRAKRAERNRRILALRKQGATQAAVAEALGVHVNTVKGVERAMREAEGTKAISG